MATVYDTKPLTHHLKSSAHASHRMSTSRHSATTTSQLDQYHGHRLEYAGLCTRYITHLFHCPHMPAGFPNHPQARLDRFISYALARTNLPTAVMFSALILLSRLKAKFPAAKGSSGHRLFISAFMISCKVLCDDSYSNKSWKIVGQGIFSLREINQMEHEMVNYLDWELTVDPITLTHFEAAVRRDFAPDAPQPYPKYPLEMICKRARDAATATASRCSTDQCLGPSSSSIMCSSSSLELDDQRRRRRVVSPMAISSPEEQPVIPVLSPSSTSASPATTASPETPISDKNMDVAAIAVDTSAANATPRFELRPRLPHEFPHIPGQHQGKQHFAQAIPARW